MRKVLFQNRLHRSRQRVRNEDKSRFCDVFLKYRFLNQLQLLIAPKLVNIQSYNLG